MQVEIIELQEEAAIIQILIQHDSLLPTSVFLSYCYGFTKVFPTLSMYKLASIFIILIECSVISLLSFPRQ